MSLEEERHASSKNHESRMHALIYDADKHHDIVSSADLSLLENTSPQDMEKAKEILFRVAKYWQKKCNEEEEEEEEKEMPVIKKHYAAIVDHTGSNEASPLLLNSSSSSSSSSAPHVSINNNTVILDHDYYGDKTPGSPSPVLSFPYAYDLSLAKMNKLKASVGQDPNLKRRTNTKKNYGHAGSRHYNLANTPGFNSANLKKYSDDSPYLMENLKEQKILAFIFASCLLVFILLIAKHYVFHLPENNEEDDSVHYTLMRKEQTLIGQGFHAVTKDDPLYLHFAHHHDPIKCIDVKVAVEKALQNDIPEEAKIEFGIYEISPDDRSEHFVGGHGQIYLDVDVENDRIKTYDTSKYNFSHKEDLYYKVTTNSTRPLGFMMEIDTMHAIGNSRPILGCILIVVVFSLIISEVIHRTAAALIGSFVCLLVVSIVNGPPTLDRVTSWLDVGTLALLFSMMLIVNALSTTGVFQWTAVRAAVISGGSVSRLLVILCVLTALFSSFLDNVTTILLFVPVTIEICRLLHIEPMPFLISEVMFCNIGGAATLIGDPPNILIGSAYPNEASFADFLINATPCVLLVSPPIMYFLMWYYKDYLPKAKKEFDVSMLKKKYRIADEIQLSRILVILGFVLIGFFTEPVHHLQSVWLAMAGAVAVILISGHHNLQSLLMNIEWETLLFFAGLFVIIECVRELGVIDSVGGAMADIINGISDDQQRLSGAVVIVLWISCIGTAVLDSIPCTLLMIPVIQQISDDSNIKLDPLIWALSLGACLGGNATLVGASANLVMAGLANKEKISVDSKKFSKVGVPITFITCCLATGYILVRYCL